MMAGGNGGNIVAEWLRSLHLGQYAESFIDNGYDDLEICKQVGDPDLDAIGVFNPTHRARLLQSVRTLREEGAASVYFSLEESVAVHEECLCDNVSARSSRTSSGRCSDKDQCGIGVIGVAPAASPAASSSADSGPELAKYADEYEEGKAELVKIPRMQLKILLRDKLAHDGIKLTCQPYTTPAANAQRSKRIRKSRMTMTTNGIEMPSGRSRQRFPASRTHDWSPKKKKKQQQQSLQSCQPTVMAFT